MKKLRFRKEFIVNFITNRKSVLCTVLRLERDKFQCGKLLILEFFMSNNSHETLVTEISILYSSSWTFSTCETYHERNYEWRMCEIYIECLFLILKKKVLTFGKVCT